MNLAMPSYMYYSDTHNEEQSTTTRILRAVHVPADISKLSLFENASQSSLASKMCA
jgi:hypothetical protein